jgi:hypothetical protein
VRASGVSDAAETLKAIADDGAGRVEAALGEAGDRRCTEAGDPTQLQSNRLSFVGRLDRDDKRRLARSPSTSLAAAALTAEIDVIDLDPPGEPFGRVALKHDTCFNLCFTFQVVVCVTPRRRPSSMLQMPCLLWVR